MEQRRTDANRTLGDVAIDVLHDPSGVLDAVHHHEASRGLLPWGDGKDRGLFHGAVLAEDLLCHLAGAIHGQTGHEELFAGRRTVHSHGAKEKREVLLTKQARDRQALAMARFSVLPAVQLQLSCDAPGGPGKT